MQTHKNCVCRLCCRWRARALSVQTCPADSERPLLPVPPQSPSTLLACPERSPSAHAKLQQELSFAMLHETRTKQQQPGAQPLQQHSDPQQGHKEQQTTLLSDASHSAGDDQVLFDAELASYISDTDYTDLRCADFEVSPRCLPETRSDGQQPEAVLLWHAFLLHCFTTLCCPTSCPQTQTCVLPTGRQSPACGVTGGAGRQGSVGGGEGSCTCKALDCLHCSAGIATRCYSSGLVHVAPTHPMPASCVLA